MTHLVVHFLNARRAQLLSLRKLAELVGYSNLNKGIRRISQFESGGSIHAKLLLLLGETLDIDVATIRQLLDKDRRDFVESWNAWANGPHEPYVVLYVMSAVYTGHTLPEEITNADEAEVYAATLAATLHRRCCLVWTRRVSVMFDSHGQLEDRIEVSPGEPHSPFIQFLSFRFLPGIGAVTWPESMTLGLIEDIEKEIERSK